MRGRDQEAGTAGALQSLARQSLTRLPFRNLCCPRMARLGKETGFGHTGVRTGLVPSVTTTEARRELGKR